MEIFKGTLGPWSYGHAKIKGYDLHELCVFPENQEKTEKGYRMICRISPSECMDDLDKYNTQLIAHAPEMLEAMQSFVSGFESDYVLDDGTIVDNPYEWLVVEYHKCKALLTRATTI